jgi:hypothetical protein
VKQVINANRDDSEHYEFISVLVKLQNNPKALQRWKGGRKMFI